MERGRYMYKILASLLATFVLALVLTPLVRRLSFRIGAVDNPNARRVNRIPMPTMGGLAIFVAFNTTNFFLLRDQYPLSQLVALLLAQSLIIMTGMIDDIFELKPRQKVLGITLAALVVYFIANIKMNATSLECRGHREDTANPDHQLMLTLFDIIRDQEVQHIDQFFQKC